MEWYQQVDNQGIDLTLKEWNERHSLRYREIENCKAGKCTLLNDTPKIYGRLRYSMINNCPFWHNKAFDCYVIHTEWNR
jgi:hypothetical protein